MSNLGPILRWLYPGASDRDEYRLADDGAGPYIAAWSVPGVEQPTVEAVMAQEAGWLLAGGAAAILRDAAKAILDNDAAAAVKLLRAVALVAMDEVNALRQWITDFKAASSAATSLANLQARVAALSSTPQRTKAQLYNGVKSRLDGGEAD